MEIQLIWEDPITHQPEQPILQTPVALGGVFNAMPSVWEGQGVSRIVVNDNQIAGYHALILERDGELILVDQNTHLGTLVNGVALPSSSLIHGDEIQLGSCRIKLRLGDRIVRSGNGCDRIVGFLFKRRCGRIDRTNCPYCQGGQVVQDPYMYDYNYYPDYGRYESWERSYSYQQDVSDSGTYQNEVDFTEGDAVAFETEMDQDFEQDFGAS